MQLRSFNIGPVTVSPQLILAPMSGVTNIAFRRLIREIDPSALGLVVTEFVSIEGLTRGNDQSLRMLERAPEERPFSMQIFGHDINRMVDAARIAQDRGADIVDINSGCPVPKVVRKGGGCELMRDPEHLGRMLSTVRQAIQVPLTLKIRAGWDDNNRNALEIARIAEDAGVSMLAVHGRTRQQLYRGQADWEIVGEIASKLKIPVIGSGDVENFESAVQSLRSGVSGLMIGRAALANPWVFSDIARAARGEEVKPRAASEVPKLIKRYTELLAEHCSRRSAFGKLKQIASQVTRLVPGSSQVRRDLCTSQTVEVFHSRLAAWQDMLLSAEAKYGAAEASHYLLRHSQQAVFEQASGNEY